jgi:5-methylcytosine-specific restriction protein A
LVTDRGGFCDAHRRETFRVQKQVATEDYKERNRFYQRAAWKRLRARHLQIEPMCRKCRQKGGLVEASHVDHIIPFQSVDDPLALDENNLQSLCHSCHSAKTRSDEARGRSKV